MGLFGRNKESRLKGTARIISVSVAPHEATHSNLRMDLVVEVPGVPAYAHGYKKMVMPVSKWPTPGGTVPVSVDPNDHDDVEIPWDDIPKNKDLAKRQAEEMAALMRSGQGSSQTGAPADMLNSLQQMFPGATIAAGADPFAPPPTVTTQGGINIVASQSDADPVERLEKLAKLRASGVIDDQQFNQLREQILGQAGLDG
jgi:hypothetical protein